MKYLTKRSLTTLLKKIHNQKILANLLKHSAKVMTTPSNMIEYFYLLEIKLKNKKVFLVDLSLCLPLNNI